MKELWKLLCRRVGGLLFALTILLAGAHTLQRALPAESETTSSDTAWKDEAPVPLPILMYHSVLEQPKAGNAWAVSPDVLEEDLRYLQKHGYESVTPTELIAYVNGVGELPKKPVMLTFDDGQYNNLLYALPLLRQYGMRALISPIGFKVDEFSGSHDQNPSYAYVSWEDLCMLSADGTFEIGNHTYNLHTNGQGRGGVTRKIGESVEEHRKVLEEDVGKLQLALENNCGFSPATFVYPFGQWDKESETVLQGMGFEVMMTCYERMNYITRDPDCLLRLCRFNRAGGISTKDFMEKALSG